MVTLFSGEKLVFFIPIYTTYILQRQRIFFFCVLCMRVCVRELTQGLAECPIPMPSKLVPPPGKRPLPSPVPPSKKSPKKIEPREVCAVDSVPTLCLWFIFLGSRARLWCKWCWLSFQEPGISSCPFRLFGLGGYFSPAVMCHRPRCLFCCI